MYTVVIAIGKDVDGVAMSQAKWQSFRDDVENTLYLHGATTIQKPARGPLGGQLGVWEGEVEQAATFLAFVDDKDVEFNSDFRQELERIRNEYGQDAIGFVVAPNTDNII